MTVYDLGDGVQLRHKVYVDGVLTSAAVSVTVTKPDGTTISPAVTQTSTGIFDAAEFVVDQLRLWDYVWTVSGTVDDLSAGQFTVGTVRPVYCDLDTLRLALGMTDTARDTLLEGALRAASRAIERACNGRRFYADAAVSARTYRTRGRVTSDPDGEVILVDDIADDTGLIVETGTGSSWSTVTDYLTEPDNALARDEPITQLRRDYGCWRSGTNKVRVTARWGWPAVPDDVVEAVKILAGRLYKRKDSPEGVMGNAEWGVIRLSRTDPDVQAMVDSFGTPGMG